MLKTAACRASWTQAEVCVLYHSIPGEVESSAGQGVPMSPNHVVPGEPEESTPLHVGGVPGVARILGAEPTAHSITQCRPPGPVGASAVPAEEGVNPRTILPHQPGPGPSAV